MKLEVTVAEIADIFKVIQERPEQLSEYDPVGCSGYRWKVLDGDDGGGVQPYSWDERPMFEFVGNEKHRNGSYDRSFTLKNIGEVKVKVPRDRTG